VPSRNSIGLDTTVIVRLLTGEPRRQFKKAKKFVKDQIESGKDLFVSDLVIAESYFALCHHYNIAKDEVIIHLTNLVFSGVIYPAPDSVCLDVLDNAPRYKAGFVDQLIYRQYCRSLDRTASFDKSLSKFEKTILL
jgi:predicted nucleic-acid-binding protein